ncbi:MAG: cysteine methyltransferase [Candidatus Komeilibacteria bacterium CG_4_10_14_0_2_um_filter_37_10]|uniref:Cysteine methyltransferase n=1 Tax=Candidatus Komeilibacteria bacterium CG_4_10_14_0_2_um_filter_37_10 TaxID=1974470 RepID=A0A2M7VET8_9BACT|nr:MAG: cysteine methyltransferase [Candidatus Komeilibacteria bacterium CG_4_10_14_0_2_um_filter_37_10]
MINNFYQRVYQQVSQVPRGRVATYGQIAALLGSPRSARQVGWALHLLPVDSRVPWQRIINQKGRISTSCQEHTQMLQATLLRKEHVEVTKNQNGYFINLMKYGVKFT